MKTIKKEKICAAVSEISITWPVWKSPIRNYSFGSILVMNDAF